MRWLYSITDSMDMNLSNSRRLWRTEGPRMLQFMGLQRVEHVIATEQQQTYPNIHFIQVRMVIMEKSTNNKCWRRYGEKETLLDYWCECELVQSYEE